MASHKLQPGSLIALGLPDVPRGRFANTPPTFINRSLTTVPSEGSLATLTGTIIDLDPLDIFYLTVDWGDGTRPETFRFGPRSDGTTIQVTHRYRIPGTYEVRFSWRDQHDFGNSDTLIASILASASFEPEVFQDLTLLNDLDDILADSQLN